MDGIANLFIRRPGIRPCASSITIGSHIDSQPNGVRLDGVYGVAVGLELLQTLDEANIGTEHPVDVAIWTNEEGCRFSPGAMGSAFFTGSESLDHLVNRSDAHGILLEQALAAAFAAFADAPIREYDHAIAAYLEPHIEQGPVLETNVIPIGIVTGIQGVRWCDVEIEGRAAHAGTTPQSSRADAFMAAADCVSAVLQGWRTGTTLCVSPSAMRV